MSDEKLLPPTAVRSADAVDAWIDLVETGDQLVRARLERDFGPQGAEERYARIRSRELAEHDRHFEKFVAELARRSRR